MARYSDTVKDENGAPLPGALVLVQNSSTGDLAALTDDSGFPLANPVRADALGGFAYNVTDDYYDNWYTYGGRLILKDRRIPIGTVVIPAGSVVDSLGSSTIAAPSQNAVTQAISAFALSTGSSLVGFLQSGTGAAPRTAQAKLRDFASNTDYSGDDSAAMTAAIAARRNVVVPSGSSLTLGDVPLSNVQSVSANGAAVAGKSGAANLFTLSDYYPVVRDAYVSDGRPLSGPQFRVLKSRYARLDGITSVNGGAGLIALAPASPGTEAVSLPIISNCDVEDIAGTAISIGSSVSELRASNVHAYGLLSFPGGLGKVTSGTVGYRQNTPLVAPGNFARGGHQLSQLNMINFERGYYLSNTELTNFLACEADGCSDYGLLVDGTADHVNFYGFSCGTTRGIKVANTAVVNFDGLMTILTGVIPPWAALDFFNGVTTFYDVEVRDTAIVTISGRWSGGKKIAVDPTAKLIVDCGTKWFGRTTSVGPSSTTYAFEGGNTPTEADAVWRAPCAGTIVGISVAPVVAPGAGQYTYTARKNFANTSATVTLTGSATGGDFWVPDGSAHCASGDSIAMQIVTNGSAPSSRHQTIIHFVPD